MLITAMAIRNGTKSLLQEVTGGPQGALPGNGVGQTGTLVTHVIGLHASATATPTRARATPVIRRSMRCIMHLTNPVRRSGPPVRVSLLGGSDIDEATFASQAGNYDAVVNGSRIRRVVLLVCVVVSFTMAALFGAAAYELHAFTSRPYRGPLLPASRASAVAFAWPRTAPTVGTIHAPKPPADDVRLYKPILLSAYQKACSNVTSVQSAFTHFRPRSELIMIRCGDRAGVRAVRLVFTGVVVPDMRPVLRSSGMQPQNALTVVGLGWRIVRRSVQGRHPDAFVSQQPPAGRVVPFGTVVRVVIAR